MTAPEHFCVGVIVIGVLLLYANRLNGAPFARSASFAFVADGGNIRFENFLLRPA